MLTTQPNSTSLSRVAVCFISILFILHPAMADQIMLQYSLNFGGDSSSSEYPAGEFNLLFQPNLDTDVRSGPTINHAATRTPINNFDPNFALETDGQITIPLSRLFDFESPEKLNSADNEIDRLLITLGVITAVLVILGVAAVGYLVHEASD